MKKLLLPLALVLTLHHASAAPLYFDPFADATANGGTSYTPGSSLINQKNNSANIWNLVNTAAGGAQPVIATNSLSYPDMPQSTGNAVYFVPSGVTANQGVRLNFNATIPTNTAYFSYLLRITDLSTVPTNASENFFGGWSDGSTAQPGSPVLRVGTKILTIATNGGFILGVGRNNTVADYVYDSTVHTTNETLFIVGSYEYFGTVTNVNLWINPATNTFGSTNAPTPTVSATHFSSTSGDINTTRVAGFIIVCQNSTAPSGLIDELRIGTNWSDVTGGDPAILTQPASVIKQPGTTATFSVTARGTANLSYQWYKDNSQLNNGGNISGATNATLTVSGVSSGDMASYSVFVTNGLGNFVQSSGATLSLLTDPIVTNQPQSITVAYGSNAVFQVTASGTSPFTYQWHKDGFDLSDGGNISGSHSNILTVSSVAYPDHGDYSVTVTNALHDAVDSSNATLTVLDPYITSQPASATNAAGTTATFHVAAIGSGGSLTYEWFKNGGFFFDDGTHIIGTISDTLTISNVSTLDQADYTVQVFGSTTATSSVATLTVAQPAAVTVPPIPRTVAAGARVAFTVTASGSTPIFYQWQLEGVNVTNNATATTSALIVSNAQANVAGNYRVVVSNAFGPPSTSAAALLTVSNTLSLSSNNLIVIRAGDGAQSLSLTGNSMFLDQYDTNGNYVNTVTIPDSGPTAMVTMGQDNLTGVNAGATTGSCISQSLDGRFMVIAGYNTNLTYGSGLNSSSASAVPRGIGLVDSHGLYTMPVSSTSSTLNSTSWRSGLADGTNNYWGGADQPGTYYFGFDSAAGTIQTDMPNMRSMSLFNGDIYCAGATSGKNGVLKVSGLPKTATNGTFLFAGSTGTFDMAVNPAGNLIYVADQRAIGATGGGVLRYDLVGTNWVLSYTLQIGGLGQGTHGPRYVAADFRGATPVVYVTSNDGTFDNNRIIKVVDTDSSATGTTIAYAGANSTFRGIHFGPIPNTVVAPPLLSYSVSGNNLILSWTGSFFLQSATNVLGTYTNIVPTPTSPYTNSLNAASQLYFRLKQ